MPNRPSRATRRDFLKHSTLVAGAGVWIATGQRTWALDEQSPNDRLNVASIGVGGKGDSDSEHAGKHANLVAICDVDEQRLAKKAEKFPKAQKFTDYRQMFDKMGKQFDAVTISTPDNHHYLATMMAIKAGKHVYTQKPMTHDVWEARQLRLAAKEHKIASQMGNQGTASSKLREGVELIRAGVLGSIKEVHIWTNRPVWPQAPKVVSRPPEVATPDYLHWDEWIGPAPMRPYAEYPEPAKEGVTAKRGKGAYHSFNWRGWWDFGTGALGDMGCHTANLPFMALKLAHPSAFQGECGDLNPETYPSWAKVAYDFPAREGMPAVKVNWYEGSKNGKLVHPPEELVTKVLAEYNKSMAKDPKFKKAGALNNSGSIIVGEKGMLYSPHDYGGAWALLPAEDYRDYKAPPQVLPRNDKGDEGQKIEWIAACKGGPAALANFDYAGMLTEFILLGNIAIANQGKRLEWDGPNMKFPNAPEAEKRLRRQYREGWSI